MSVTVLSFAALAVTVIVAATPSQMTNNNLHDNRQGKGVMFGWHTMGDAKRSCVGMNGRPGVCMGQDECTSANGKSVGKCFPFDSCCSITPNSCGGYSSLSTAYFQNPDKFQEVCTYKINVKRNVCQLRIDFEKFSLGQPTKQSNESAYFCERDEFSLLSSDNKKMNLPVLCGENSGQHVYVPINQQQTTSSESKNRHHVTLRFQLTPRDDDYTDAEPLWKVKISQLECQNAPANWWKIKDIARQVWDWEDEERDVAKSKYSLAPDGCLQYFTDQKGSFESFNYNKGTGHYLGNLNYAVCFKRYQDTCGIRHEAVKFQVAYRRKLSGSTDRDCDTAADAEQTTTTSTSTTTSSATSTSTTVAPSTTSTTVAPTTAAALSTEATDTTNAAARRRAGEAFRHGGHHAIFFAETGGSLVHVDSEVRNARRRKWTASAAADEAASSDLHGDYLLVPDGVYSAGKLAASKYCDKSLERTDDVAVKTQGPLYVAFVSDDVSNPDEDVEKGYKINYSVINTGC